MKSIIALLTALPSSGTSESPAQPPCSGPEYRSLDFWVGEWDLSFTDADGSPGRATNRIRRDEFGSCVISEHFAQAGNGYVGASYSAYDRRARVWRQTWVDNSGEVIELVGGPVTGQPHSFEFRTTELRGPRSAHFRMIWENVRPDRLTWRWQEQAENGSFVDRWVIRYHRRR